MVPRTASALGRPVLRNRLGSPTTRVAVQDRDPESTLNLYRRALALRRDTFTDDDFNWVDTDSTVLAFDRGAVRCVSNFGDHPVDLPPGEVLISSSALADGSLPAESAAWVRVDA